MPVTYWVVGSKVGDSVMRLAHHAFALIAKGQVANRLGVKRKVSRCSCGHLRPHKQAMKTNRTNQEERGPSLTCMCACVYVRVRACACVCACVSSCPPPFLSPPSLSLCICMRGKHEPRVCNRMRAAIGFAAASKHLWTAQHFSPNKQRSKDANQSKG